MIVLMMFVLTTFSFADQVMYEPGPADGMDVWLSSYYNYGDDYGVDDWKLQAGGWGDEYRFLIQFDLTDLPSNPTSAVMWMLPYDRGDSSTLVGLYVDRVTSSWDESTGWYDQPTGVNVGSLSAPDLNYWYGIGFTGIYNDWKAGTYPNYGFKFRPVSTNNEYSQFYSSDLSSVNHWARPKLVVTYNGANLEFPLAGYTPYTASISAVVDHSAPTFNCADNIVVAYTGERGELQYGASTDKVGPSNACPDDLLYGFKNSSRTEFSINGQYSAKDGGLPNNLLLFYDGHTGYDYPANNGTLVYAAADGGAEPYGDGIKIVHPSGYDTYYLHLSESLIGTGQTVLKGALIGKVGLKHLHFTVKKGTQRVDPYGWKGEWGTDPLQIDGKDNVCLWENCKWW